MGVLEDYLGDRLAFISESSLSLLGRPCIPAIAGASGPVVKDQNENGGAWEVDTSEDPLTAWRQAESQNYQLQVSVYDDRSARCCITPAVVDLLQRQPQRTWSVNDSAKFDVNDSEAFAAHVAQEAAKGDKVLLTLTCLEAEATLRSGAPAASVATAVLGAELQVTVMCAPKRPGNPAVALSLATQGGPPPPDVVDLDVAQILKHAKRWRESLFHSPESWAALRVRVAGPNPIPGRRPPQLYAPEAFGEAPDDDVVLVERCVITLDEPLPVQTPRRAEHHRRIEDGLRRAAACAREREGVEGTLTSQICVEGMDCIRNMGHDSTIAHVAIFHDRIAEVLSPHVDDDAVVSEPKAGQAAASIAETPGVLQVVRRAGAGVASGSGTRLRTGRTAPIKYEVDQAQTDVIYEVFGSSDILGPFAYLCLMPQKANVANLRDLMAQALVVQPMETWHRAGFMEMYIPKTGNQCKKCELRIYVSEGSLDQAAATTKVMHVGKALVCVSMIPQATCKLLKNLNESKKSSRAAELMHLCRDDSIKTREAVMIPRSVVPRFEQFVRDMETKVFLPLAPTSNLVIANLEHLAGVDIVLHTELGPHLTLEQVGPGAKCVQVECSEVSSSGSRGLSILLEFPCTPGEAFSATYVLPRKSFCFRARELNSVGPGAWGCWTSSVRLLSVPEGLGALQQFLMLAIENDNCRQAGSLLTAGADPNGGEPLPLLVAVKRGVCEMVALLLDAGGDIHRGDLLHSSAREGKNAVEVSDLLISRGAQVCGKNADGDTPLEVALKFRPQHKIGLGVEAPLIRLLRPFTNHIPPASERDRLKLPAPPGVVELDPDLTPPAGTLAAAVYASNMEEISNLIQCKCDPNRQEGDERPPLLLAVEKGDADTCKMLLEGGANVHERIGANKSTYLGVAVQGGYSDIARMLINSGIDVNTRDRWGERPLTVALRRGEYCPLVRLLRAFGAQS